MAANPFDQFDAPQSGNPFDQFDDHRQMPPAKDRQDPFAGERIPTTTPQDTGAQRFAQADKSTLPLAWNVKLGAANAYAPTVTAYRDNEAGGYIFEDTNRPGQFRMVVRNNDGSLTSKPFQYANPVEGMSKFKQLAAGVGKVPYDTARGVKQLVGMLPESLGGNTPEQQQAAYQQEQQVRQQDAPLMATTPGKVGYVGGVLATSLTPGIALKGAGLAANAAKATRAGAALDAAGNAIIAPATVPKAALVGAATGLVQPTTSTGEKAANVVFGAAGGAAGKLVGDAVGVAARAAKSAFMAGKSAASASSLVDDTLRASGINPDNIDPAALDAVKSEVKAAISTNGNIDQNALRRKLDFIATGVQPTLGTITRKGQQFAREKVLRGIEGSGTPLAALEESNNTALIGNLNKLGAARSNMSFDNGADYAAGKSLQEPLANLMEASKNHISQLYKTAEDMNGRPIEMDHAFFTQRAGELVDKTGKNAFLPESVKSYLNQMVTPVVDAATGQTKTKLPLTIGTAEQLKTILANETRKATRADDGNAIMALKAVRQALEETPMLNEKPAGSSLALPGVGGQSSLGQDTVNAFRAARAANSQYRATVESSPALSDIENGMQPDKFFAKHVIGANVQDLQKTAEFLKSSPQAYQQVKDDILGYLKNKALNGKTEEDGVFSQSAYNKALENFGKKKLEAFFTPDEIAHLQAVGRVARYIQKNPAGSIGNPSGSAIQGFNVMAKAIGSVTDVARKSAALAKTSYDTRSALGAKIPVTREPSKYRGALSVPGSALGSTLLETQQ